MIFVLYKKIVNFMSPLGSSHSYNNPQANHTSYLNDLETTYVWALWSTKEGLTNINTVLFTYAKRRSLEN